MPVGSGQNLSTTPHLCVATAHMSPIPAPIEAFSSLSAISGLRHGFLQRVPDLPVECDKMEVLSRLEPHHQAASQQLLGAGWTVATAEQVHEAEVAVVTEENRIALSQSSAAGVDGFVTATPQAALGIYVADCGAVFLADPVRRAVGLVHSGKNGTKLGITVRAIELMGEHFESRPEDLVVVLGPCIRPPAYEIDFAADIRRQCLDAGVPPAQYHDSGQCTSSNLELYYSYRMEKGKTGRMLALLGYE